MFLAAGLAPLLQVACTGQPDPSPLADYASRLARTPNGSPHPLRRFVPPPYPDADDRQVPRADVRVGLGDFLDLKACGLRSLVAERNSALGKLEGDGLRLVYEHALITGLTRCLRRLEESGKDPALAASLREVLEAKRLDTGPMIWNATIGSREFAALYRVSAPALDPVRAEPAPDKALRGLAEMVSRYGQEDASISRDVLIGYFEDLERSGHGGRLAKSLGRATGELAVASQALATISCPSSTETDLKAARERFEGGDVAQWLAALSAAGSRWQRALDRLLAAQSVAPPEGFMDYYQQLMNPANDKGIWPAFLAAYGQHRNAWSEFSARCTSRED